MSLDPVEDLVREYEAVHPEVSKINYHGKSNSAAFREYCGILYKQNPLLLQKIIFGGDQERHKREPDFDAIPAALATKGKVTVSVMINYNYLVDHIISLIEDN